MSRPNRQENNPNGVLKSHVDEVPVVHSVPLGALGYYSASTNAVLTKNAAGDWSYNRIAGGAETHTFHAMVPISSNVAGKGAKLTGARLAYQIGVADATSVDLKAYKTVFAQATAPAVTSDFPEAVADASYDSAHDTAAERADKDVTSGEHVLTLTFTDPSWPNFSEMGQVLVEAVFVLANTGTLKVRAFELLYTVETESPSN